MKHLTSFFFWVIFFISFKTFGYIFLSVMNQSMNFHHHYSLFKHIIYCVYTISIDSIWIVVSSSKCIIIIININLRKKVNSQEWTPKKSKSQTMVENDEKRIKQNLILISFMLSAPNCSHQKVIISLLMISFLARILCACVCVLKLLNKWFTESEHLKHWTLFSGGNQTLTIEKINCRNAKMKCRLFKRKYVCMFEQWMYEFDFALFNTLSHPLIYTQYTLVNFIQLPQRENNHKNNKSIEQITTLKPSDANFWIFFFLQKVSQ